MPSLPGLGENSQKVHIYPLDKLIKIVYNIGVKRKEMFLYGF